MPALQVICSASYSKAYTQKLQSVQNGKAHGVHSLPSACCCKCMQTKLLLLHILLPCFSSAVLTYPSVVNLQGSTRQPESRSLLHEVSCVNKGRRPRLCHDEHLPRSEFQLCLTRQAGACALQIRLHQTSSNCRDCQHPVTGLKILYVTFIMSLHRLDLRYTIPRIHLSNMLRMIHCYTWSTLMQFLALSSRRCC